MRSIRRQILLGLGTAAVAATFPTVLQDEKRRRAPSPRAPLNVRRLALHDLHTGEAFDDAYWADGAYVPDALAAARHVLRDWRNGEEHAMDLQLFDLLHAIAERLEVNQPFAIISGYRSPATNAMLHARSEGVASHSQHMQGKACDICIEGVRLTDLHRAALSLKAGGVGLYPISGFVHVDVARVRSWQGA